MNKNTPFSQFMQFAVARPKISQKKSKSFRCREVKDYFIFYRLKNWIINRYIIYNSYIIIYSCIITAQQLLVPRDGLTCYYNFWLACSNFGQPITRLRLVSSVRQGRERFHNKLINPAPPHRKAQAHRVNIFVPGNLVPALHRMKPRRDASLFPFASQQIVRNLTVCECDPTVNGAGWLFVYVLFAERERER